MKVLSIQDKLQEIEFAVEDICLGDFDRIGEHTARKARSPSDPLFKSAGCFFRPNYERGILIYHLIKRFEMKSFLEIGFGRGYASLCAAKAMCDMGWDDGRVYSVDPNIDEQHLKLLSQAYPKEWLGKINLMQGTIDEAFSTVKEEIDLIYIDGDHRYEAVKHDWDVVKDKFRCFALFDDYDEDGPPQIEVKRLVDELDVDKELIISDRMLFNDDRNLKRRQYGQVLIKNPSFNDSEFLSGW